MDLMIFLKHFQKITQMTNKEGKEVIRYQDASHYVKIWRCRHLIAVPYYTLKHYCKMSLAQRRAAPFKHMKLMWGTSLGMAHIAMEWWYTLDEVIERFESIFDKD